jgi:hypothetical protein
MEQDRILRKGLPGSWYINPLFRVYSNLPTPEFFKAARRYRGAFFREFRLRLGGNGWRNQRKVDLKNGDADQNDGILIIEGMKTEMSRIGELETAMGYRPIVQHRSEAFRFLKLQDLKSLQELIETTTEECLSSPPLDPDNAYVILPAATVRCRFPSEEFFGEASRREGEWRRKVNWLVRNNTTTKEFKSRLSTLPVHASHCLGRQGDLRSATQ